MSTQSGNGVWKIVAVGLISLTLGGGVGSYTGSVAAQSVREDLENEITLLRAEAKVDSDRNVVAQLTIIKSLARLEAQVEFIIKGMD